MKALFIDFETYSEVEIKKHGSMRYLQDGSTEPICMAYAFWDGPVQMWEQGQNLTWGVLDHVSSGGKVYAHNAAFDMRVWNMLCVEAFGWPEIVWDQVVDSMALCMTFSLPASLGGAGEALGAPVQKSAGARLIKKCCTPQPVKHGRQLVGHQKPDMFSEEYKVVYEELKEYCLIDVAAMRSVVQKLPRQELIPVEHEIWKITAQMNHEGLPIDELEVTSILSRIELALDEGKKELSRITKRAAKDSGDLRRRLEMYRDESLEKVSRLVSDYREPVEGKDLIRITDIHEVLEEGARSLEDIYEDSPASTKTLFSPTLYREVMAMLLGTPLGDSTSEMAKIKKLVKKSLKSCNQTVYDLHKRANKKAHVTSPFQYARIKDFCDTQGFPIQSCQGAYIQDLLNDPEVKLPKVVEEVLTLCQKLGKSSTAKYRKMADYRVPGKAEDHRVHDSLCYHGAGTGRWAGRGVQPQNFPRAQSKQPEEDILEFVEQSPMEDPIGVSKSLLRSVIKAPEGQKLIVSDYSSIENRVLAWVAGDEETLQGFREGFDQYIDMASSKFNRSYKDIKDGYDAEDPESIRQRSVGKVIVLGCGFGMGAETFQTSAKNFGIYLTEKEAKKAVGAYREKYYKVAQCWKGLKKAAIRAVISGDRQTFGSITFGTAKVNGVSWLAMRLPSGKSIYYCSPSVEDRAMRLPSGKSIYCCSPSVEGRARPKFKRMWKVATVVHMGVNPLTRKWTRVPLIPGRITENAVQGLAREIMGRGLINVRERMPEVTLIGTVHDEAIGLMSDEDATGSSLEKFNSALCDVDFVPGLPVEAKGYISKRYKK